LKRAWQWSALALLACTVMAAMLVAAEMIVRTREQPPSRSYMVSDPVLHHRLRVNAVQTVVGGEFRTNSLGLRDREYPTVKPPGVMRILMLGDSFTEGAGLAAELTVPRLLEGLLNGRCGRAFEVVNAGMGSYSPILEYLVLKTIGLALQPDLVILEFDMTDLKDDLLRTATARFDAQGLPLAVPGDHRIERALLMPPIPKPRWLRFLDPVEARLNHSRLYYDFRRSPMGERLLGSLKLTPERLAALGLVGSVQYDYGAPTRDVEGPGERQAWDRSERYVVATRDLARSRGIAFALTINPHPQQVSASESPVGRLAVGVGPGFYASDRAFRRLETFGRRHGIPVLNPLRLMRERTGVDGPLFKHDDIHHTPRGAAVFAEGVFRGLVDRELVPCAQDSAPGGWSRWEGPYPDLGLPFAVRWGVAPESRVAFQTSDDLPRTLRVTPRAYHGQVLTVLLDGAVVARHRFEGAVMEDLSIPLTQKAGRHAVTLRYAHWADHARAVLFRRVEIVPATDARPFARPG